jgi:hypothetical protein
LLSPLFRFTVRPPGSGGLGELDSNLSSTLIFFVSARRRCAVGLIGKADGGSGPEFPKILENLHEFRSELC